MHRRYVCLIDTASLHKVSSQMASVLHLVMLSGTFVRKRRVSERAGLRPDGWQRDKRLGRGMDIQTVDYSERESQCEEHLGLILGCNRWRKVGRRITQRR
jgi:hypothetical protein